MLVTDTWKKLHEMFPGKSIEIDLRVVSYPEDGSREQYWSISVDSSIYTRKLHYNICSAFDEICALNNPQPEEERVLENFMAMEALQGI